MSYADLYMRQFSASNKGKSSKPDLYLFGVPFDATCSYKPGTRFGPNSLRDAFLNIEVNSTRYDVKIQDLTIEDLGNLRFTVNTETMLEMVNKVTKEVTEKGLCGILGGEHLITLGSYRAMPEDTTLVVFDAHYDLRDEYTDMKYSHATFLRRVIEERKSDVIHVGARGFGSEEEEFRDKMKIRSITSKELLNGRGKKEFIDALSTVDSLYLSIDIDVIDPAFAPGVGTPESLGITPNQFFDLLYTLEEKYIRCFDIVELSPLYDNGITSSLAAKMLSEIICMCNSKH